MPVDLLQADDVGARRREDLRDVFQVEHVVGSGGVVDVVRRHPQRYAAIVVAVIGLSGTRGRSDCRRDGGEDA